MAIRPNKRAFAISQLKIHYRYVIAHRFEHFSDKIAHSKNISTNTNVWYACGATLAIEVLSGVFFHIHIKMVYIHCIYWTLKQRLLRLQFAQCPSQNVYFLKCLRTCRWLKLTMLLIYHMFANWTANVFARSWKLLLCTDEQTCTCLCVQCICSACILYYVYSIWVLLLRQSHIFSARLRKDASSARARMTSCVKWNVKVIAW